MVGRRVSYIKRNFLALREFRDLSDANRQLHEWIPGEAGNRLHGSTREKSLPRFTTGQPLLQPLPERTPEAATWVKVHHDAHVQFEKRLYSVPFRLLGQTLWLKATAGHRAHLLRA